MQFDFTISKNKILSFIKEKTEKNIEKNVGIIKDYWNEYTNSMPSYISVENEEQIIFLIKNYVSTNFISNYFKITKKQVENLATKHKCNADLFIKSEKDSNNRLFSKMQVIRASENFNFLCPLCFKTLDITKLNTITGHHIRPFAMGGLTSQDNCLPLHTQCHLDDFKLLHAQLFDEDVIYSAKYFNLLKKKFKEINSGVSDFLPK
ncbi:MAG: hypothetical protein Ta2D_00070 [Rickettsiales bacterium]|nr:MAG: hypothetical protein Ta2D_00070 [Rickettsiales bacterium]